MATKFYCEKCNKETAPCSLVSVDAPDLRPEYDARDYCPKCAAEATKHHAETKADLRDTVAGLQDTIAALKAAAKQRASFYDSLGRADYLNQAADLLDCAPRRVKATLRARGYEGEILSMLTEFLTDQGAL